MAVAAAVMARDDAARELWTAHYGQLTGWCAGLVGNTDVAHDIAAEAYTRLLAKWGGVREPKAFRADLPLGSYSLSHEQAELLRRAADVLIADCMRRSGLACQRLRQLSPEEALDSAEGSRPPYGAWDAERARTVGYHDWSWRRMAQAGSYSEPPPVEEEKLMGSRACQAEMTRALPFPDQSEQDEMTLDRAMMTGRRAAESDPRVQLGIQKWSACMASAARANTGGSNGLTDPTAPPSQAEIDTATTDVACKERTGLIDVWLDALEREQRAMIADPRHAGLLAAQKQAVDEAVARGHAVLKGAS